MNLPLAMGFIGSSSECCL